jgi:hypothetical protein
MLILFALSVLSWSWQQTKNVVTYIYPPQVAPAAEVKPGGGLPDRVITPQNEIGRTFSVAQVLAPIWKLI